MEVLKIGLLGVAGVMLALQFKSNKPEFGLYWFRHLPAVVFFCSIRAVVGHWEHERDGEVHKPGWSLFPHFAEGDRDYVYL